LLDASNLNYGLLLPILLHCRDDQGCSPFGSRRGRQTRDLLRNDYLDIPAAVEALRQYWMPLRTRPLIIADVGAHTGYTQGGFRRSDTEFFGVDELPLRQIVDLQDTPPVRSSPSGYSERELPPTGHMRKP
jgi:hypothetical protein